MENSSSINEEDFVIGDEISTTARIEPGAPVLLNAKIKKVFKSGYYQIEYENKGKKHVANRFSRDISIGKNHDAVNA